MVMSIIYSYFLLHKSTITCFPLHSFNHKDKIIMNRELVDVLSLDFLTKNTHDGNNK